MVQSYYVQLLFNGLKHTLYMFWPVPQSVRISLANDHSLHDGYMSATVGPYFRKGQPTAQQHIQCVLDLDANGANERDALLVTVACIFYMYLVWSPPIQDFLFRICIHFFCMSSTFGHLVSPANDVDTRTSFPNVHFVSFLIYTCIVHEICSVKIWICSLHAHG